jgi:nucleoside phosphorylase
MRVFARLRAGAPVSADAMSDSVDILLYVALSEEVDSVLAVLGSGFRPEEFTDVALTGFFGTLASPAAGRDFAVAVVPAGKMGNTHSASVMSLLIEKLTPSDVVVLGIAGSLSNDMEPGDVFVPDSVNEYLANSASHGESGAWTFTTSGNHFQTSVRLLNRLQVFAHTHPAIHQSWRDDAGRLRAELIDPATETALAAANLNGRGVCRLFAGDDRKLASGPAVGKGKAFVDWLGREVDRKVAAMEMESAGVYDAALVRTPAPRAVAIRGISDYADLRKEKLEAVAKGQFRALAARNAVALFMRAVEAGLFNGAAGDPSGQGASAGLSPPFGSLVSQVKSVLVIGGRTGETVDADAEAPRLHHAALKLGAALARAGAELVVCSPFPDSADYYTAMGYADAAVGGVIHFHSPAHAEVEEKRRLVRQTLGRRGLTIQDWSYPGPETGDADAWFQAWLLAQLQALERADAVVALGGKVSKTANTLLHLAEAKGLPVVPFAFLGGAALRSFQRRDWQRLHPGFDVSALTADTGVEQTVSIANRLLMDRMKRSIPSEGRPRTVFVSVARADCKMAVALADALKTTGIDVVLGDGEIGADQMIPASIEQAIRRSDVVAILWSRAYAQSPWCFDELDLALTLEALGGSRIWLFNLDDSAIVPSGARKLPAVSVRGPDGLRRAVRELLA